MRIYNKIKQLFYILFRINKIAKTNSYILITDATDKDKRDLALGRWTQYKNLRVPEFHIKMDKDAESMLFQHTFHQINGGLKLSPDQLLEQVDMMITICDKAIEKGITLRAQLGVK